MASSKDEKSEHCVKMPRDDSSTTQDRPSWDNKFQYVMAALGFAVGLGNIWRFPYLCKKNGGGAFLIPYLIMLLVEGYPLYYLELAVGQKIRKGSIGVWTFINPYFGGVGVASNVISIIIGLYYNMILGWALFYFFNSFQSPLPWSSCPLLNDTVPVPECAITSPTTYFWYRETLDLSSSLGNGANLNWRMVAVLFLAWSLVFLGMIKGIKSSGKVMYFATAFPYVVLIAFFIRAIALDGALDGISYMFSPHWNRLRKVEVWRDAATQIFFSLGLGYGSIIAYSSYNPRKNNCYKDALFIASANCATSIFACIIVFAVLGFKAKTNFLNCLKNNENMIALNLTNDSTKFLNISEPFPIPINNCSFSRELDTNVQGTGLAFIAFTEAILKFPAAPFWSLLFFFMILNIGMSSQFGILQTVVTTVLDSGVKISKKVLSAIMCTSMFIVGLIFTQRSGSYFLDVFDSYTATLSLLIVALCEVLIISYAYGIKRFENDLKEMVGSAPGLYWRVSWMVTCPLALIVILFASVWDLCSKSLTYDAWVPELGKKVPLNYPVWALFIIVVLILLAPSCVPFFALLRKFRICEPEKWVAFNADTSTAKLGSAEAVTESTQPLTATL